MLKEWTHNGKTYQLRAGDIPAVGMVLEIRDYMKNPESVIVALQKIGTFVDFVCGAGAFNDMCGEHYTVDDVCPLFESLATFVCKTMTESTAKYTDVLKKEAKVEPVSPAPAAE